MPLPQPATEGEARVIRWFLVVFLMIAVIGIGLTWFNKARACSAQCVASGQGTGDLKLVGGNRISLGTTCECTASSKQ